MMPTTVQGSLEAEIESAKWGHGFRDLRRHAFTKPVNYGQTRPVVEISGAAEAGRQLERLLAGDDEHIPKAIHDAYRYIGRSLYPKILQDTPQGRFSGRLAKALEFKYNTKAVRWTFSKVKLKRRAESEPKAPRTWHGVPFYYALWRHWGYRDRARRLRSLTSHQRKKLSARQKERRRAEFRSLTHDPWVWRIVKESEQWIAQVMTVAVRRAIRNALGES